MKPFRERIAAAVLLPVLMLACARQPGQPLFAGDDLSEDAGWEVVLNDSTETVHHLRLGNDRWLMHFLHWRTLHSGSDTLSAGYVKETMNTLWGVRFTFTGRNGNTTVNGHPAWFAEGTLNNVVKTRFIIWDCPESGRRFMSDCNINLARNTPGELLDLQAGAITRSVRCHGSPDHPENAALPQRVHYSDAAVSFSLPRSWRSNRFIVNACSDKDRPGHYPDGFGYERGTVWNLLSDSEKEITFLRQPGHGSLSAADIPVLLRKAYSDTTVTRSGSYTLLSWRTHLESRQIRRRGDLFVSSGTYDLITRIEGDSRIDTTRFLYRAFVRETGECEWVLSAGMAAYDSFWGLPVDLIPSDDQIEHLADLALSHIRRHTGRVIP